MVLAMLLDKDFQQWIIAFRLKHLASAAGPCQTAEGVWH